MAATNANYDDAVRAIVPDLEYLAEFVPQSKSRRADEKHPSLNWRIAIKRGGASMTADYMQRIGHLPGYKFPGIQTSIIVNGYHKRAAESGKYARNATEAYGNSCLGLVAKIPPPGLADVLRCLLLDAEAIDAGGFEEWAIEFGYDIDSRKAEGIYNACHETGLKLRRMLGDSKISELREALRDM